MILDTNALSAFFDDDAALLALLGVSPEMHLPVVVLGEYRFGILQSRNRRIVEPRLNQLEADSSVLDVDRNTARVYAEIREELRAAGRPIPRNDLWVAALVRQHGLELVSNDAHFDNVRGIRRLSW